jgi:hypothetical protein
MPKFIAIGYGDHAGYERTPEEVRKAAHANDDALEQRGAVMGMAGVPIQVRNPEGKGVHAQVGAFMSSQLPVAGFALIEAHDIQEAIGLVSASPCAVAHGVIEVWPLEQLGGAA